MLMIRPWSILNSKQTFQDQYLCVRTDRCVHDTGTIVPVYHVLEFTDWVTVLPLTDKGEVVLVREYRHAAQKVMVGLPGGVMDPGETDRLCAGIRELREETGHVCRDWVHIGSCYPNPAIQTNRLHYYLGFGAVKVADPSPDANEQIETILMPYAEFLNYRAFEVQHALHAAALFYTEAFFRQHPEKRP